ncbi:ABC transporter permease subunit [uncultured Cellulomonas sp.]|uniref:ABC transporter permease subunit n=1 Tax=uncultured Cellulomonas sp. TaxID=189682 RepID=UPI0028E910A2|nr:ABC transporter permease subunit [uncultured Cellulomonas sp.]
MSATTVPGRGATLPTFSGVLASEWTKITSLRSSSWLAALTVAASGALTYVGATASSVDPGFQPLGSLTDGVMLGQVFPLVLGVLVGTGEFSTGTFRATFTAVPRRLPVVAAQALATGAFALLVALLSVGAAVLGVLPAARSRGIALDLGVDATPQVMVGMVLFLVGLTLLGLAIGALLRRSVPAVTTAVVLVLVLPIVLTLASDVGTSPLAQEPSGLSVVDTVTTFLPSGAGWLLMMPSDGTGYDGAPNLGPWGGGLVLLAWILGLLAVAAARLRTRDVV